MKFNVDLDTFTISNYQVNGKMLYANITPQQGPMLAGELLLTFDREPATFLRQGLAGNIKVHVDDADFGGILDINPVLANQGSLHIVYQLGPGITYSGVVQALEGPQLLFAGLWSGLERPDPNHLVASNLVAWDAQTSRWNIPSAGAVDSRLP